MSNFKSGAIKQFEYYKSLGDQTLNRLTLEELHQKPNADSNNIAIIVQHLYGNMLSRWTDFLTTDGEKEWRARDAEFEAQELTKESIIDIWNKGWACLFQALHSLQEEDLDTIIYIRNIGQTAQDAVIRQLCHYSYHIGQIVYLGKMIKGNDFESLSIPKNQTQQYNKEKFDQEKSIKHFNDKG